MWQTWYCVRQDEKTKLAPAAFPWIYNCQEQCSLVQCDLTPKQRSTSCETLMSCSLLCRTAVTSQSASGASLPVPLCVPAPNRCCQLSMLTESNKVYEFSDQSTIEPGKRLTHLKLPGEACTCIRALQHPNSSVIEAFHCHSVVTGANCRPTYLTVSLLQFLHWLPCRRSLARQQPWETPHIFSFTTTANKSCMQPSTCQESRASRPTWCGTMVCASILDDINQVFRMLHSLVTHLPRYPCVCC